MLKSRIDGVFSKTSLLQIPFFQRSYVWKEENWERFLEDLKQVCISKKDYFLGTYIMKQQDTPSGTNEGVRRTVIDGQQRFTTIILFFYVLCKKQNKPQAFRDRFINYNEKIVLEHNYNDSEIFLAILTDSLTEELKEKYKNNQVLKAYEYFNKNINENDYDILTLSNRLYFVGIDVEPNEDEQQIFDTINSLGVRLTTAELLKNYLFTAKEDLELYENTWKKCFEDNIEKKEFWDSTITSGSKYRSNIDLLLYSYLTINYKKEFTIEKLFDNFKEYLRENDYTNNKSIILNNIKDYADLYYKYININCCNIPLTDKKESINRLNIIFFGLDTTTLLPYCLFVLKKSEKDEQRKIFGFLEKYIMRRIICKYSPKNYNNIFTSFIRNNILTVNELKADIYSDKKNSTQNAKMPTNEEVLIELKKNNHTNKIAKGILYLLESALRNDKDCTCLLGLSNYDLEHIMPQDWKQNWANIDMNDNNLVQNREDSIKLLGNKTLLTSQLNKSIKNANWERKKYGHKEKDYGGFEQYAKGLKTFSFENLEIWDETTIKNRIDYLYNFIVETWKYDL